MKKNISRLIVEIKTAVNPVKKESFKFTCSEAHKYTNKILVNAEEYNKPSVSEQYVNEEMKMFEEMREDTVRPREGVKKTEKKINLESRLALLERNLSYFLLQEVMDSLTYATSRELKVTKPKLVKLKNKLSISLQKEELEPHLKEALADFLADLNEIINKNSKVY